MFFWLWQCGIQGECCISVKFVSCPVTVMAFLLSSMNCQVLSPAACLVADWWCWIWGFGPWDEGLKVMVDLCFSVGQDQHSSKIPHLASFFNKISRRRFFNLVIELALNSSRCVKKNLSIFSLSAGQYVVSWWKILVKSCMLHPPRLQCFFFIFKLESSTIFSEPKIQIKFRLHICVCCNKYLWTRPILNTLW